MRNDIPSAAIVRDEGVGHTLASLFFVLYGIFCVKLRALLRIFPRIACLMMAKGLYLHHVVVVMITRK